MARSQVHSAATEPLLPCKDCALYEASHLRGAVDSLPLCSSSLPRVRARNVCQVAPAAANGGDVSVPSTGLDYALQPLVLRRVSYHWHEMLSLLEFVCDHDDPYDGLQSSLEFPIPSSCLSCMRNVMSLQAWKLQIAGSKQSSQPSFACTSNVQVMHSIEWPRILFYHHPGGCLSLSSSAVMFKQFYIIRNLQIIIQ